jgi:acetyl-CoA carboxylase biotin carboxyl carrier protein
MTLTPDDLALLLKTFQSSDWTEMALSLDGIRVSLAKSDSEQTVAGPPPAPAEQAPDPHQIHAAGIGVFRRSASPDGEPLVDTGQRVQPDDIIGLLEVFRRRDEIRAEKGGIVRAIHAENGDVVEYGRLLFTIEPDGC